ncbi:MAG TPA: cyclic nucleotide-binding domain-containing protein [Thermoanaerobaculia bacterium]|nr:cyclic nucleotide-binding domain-containing protein [Thermoanaerobaculia bacterium]
MPGGPLEAHPLFDGLPGEGLAPLAASAQEVALEPNQTLFRKGDPCDGIYLVLSGAVVIRREAVGEPIERVRDLGPGDFFGEMEALDGQPRLFAARSLGTTRLLHLRQSALAPFLAAHPAVETRLRSLGIERRTLRLKTMLAPSTRHEPRIRIDRAVQIALRDRAPISAHLEDLSPGGLCLSRVPAGWLVRAAIEFTLGVEHHPDLLPVRGLVRWHLNGLTGIGFEKVDTTQRRRINAALEVLLAGR